MLSPVRFDLIEWRCFATIWASGFSRLSPFLKHVCFGFGETDHCSLRYVVVSARQESIPYDAQVRFEGQGNRISEVGHRMEQWKI